MCANADAEKMENIKERFNDFATQYFVAGRMAAMAKLTPSRTSSREPAGQRHRALCGLTPLSMGGPGKCTECGATRFTKAVGQCGMCELRRRSESRSRRFSSPPTPKAPQRNGSELEPQQHMREIFYRKSDFALTREAVDSAIVYRLQAAVDPLTSPSARAGPRRRGGRRNERSAP
jgi:hypothetical protein